jgi:allantoate deiminase
MVAIQGMTGHSGTVPMDKRRDALVAACDVIGTVHERALGNGDVRATVGTLDLQPGAVNQIPEHAAFPVEVRSPDDEARLAFGKALCAYVEETSTRFGCSAQMQKTYEQPAQQCDASLSNALEAACAEVQGSAPKLPSGATHDASAMADLCPIAMLFVRCRNGVSHTPEEYCSDQDMALAISTVAQFLQDL